VTVAKNVTDVYPFWILLGRPASEPVPPPRIEFYRWIAGELAPTTPRLQRPEQSVAFKFEEIQEDASCIHSFLLTEPMRDGALVIIDLSETPYEIMREPLLSYVGEAARELASNPKRIVLVALPGSAPPSTSLLWEPLRGHQNKPKGSVIVIDERGSIEVLGHQRDIPKTFSKGYVTRSAELATDITERLEAKMLRRLGHFDLGAIGGSRQECSQFFFDGEHCVGELATLVFQRASQMISREDRESWRLVPCAPQSNWINETSRLAADMLEIEWKRWPKRAQKTPPNDLKGCNLILLFDVLRSGDTARAALASVEGWDGVDLKLAYAAVGPNQILKNLPGGHRVEVAVTGNLERTPRASCPQCQLNLPFTPVVEENQSHRLRAYDLWKLLLSWNWKPENYGPRSTHRFKSSPDFEKIFEEYGDFVAYRYELALQELADSEVIVVSPEEPAVGELLRRLKARFEDRIVPIGIPRDVLEIVRDDDSRIEEVLDKHKDQAWVRQLRNVEQHDESVVLIDEFSASGTTARAMVELLNAIPVKVRSFLPVIDRKPDIDLGSVPIRPLYEIPRPR
jgi:pyrimidine operon attenuation protein/uracil phosphoribosyltransferase